MQLSSERVGEDKTEVIKVASQTELGQFTGMTAAPDSALWISGERGLARIATRETFALIQRGKLIRCRLM